MTYTRVPGAWTGDDNQGIFTNTATLMKIDEYVKMTESTNSSLVAAQTTETANSHAAIFAAKPVPNKPGFIYNPFQS